jgi:type II secretory ATPase GspE/PulE/Tfp pilus assembly ATPase PilB-like protein
VAAVALLGAEFVGYGLFRNSRVSPENRWSLRLDSFRRKVVEAQAARAQAAAALWLCQPDGSRMEVPASDSPQRAAHARWQEVFEYALARHGDRIDLAVAGAEQTALVVHVDGVKYAQPKPDGRLAVSMIDYFKGHAGLDVADRRRRQIGQARIEAEGLGTHRLKIVTSGSTRDLSLSVRIDPNKHLGMALDKIGLVPAQLEQMQALIAACKGVVLVACPADEGMTTTLYALLQQHDPYTQSVATLEDEIELEIEGMNQYAQEPGADAAAIANRLTVLLRSDPNVLMLSRITDAQMVKPLLGSAAEMRCYAGLRMGDSFQALKAWIKLAGDPQQAGGALTAIVSQRLVRRLCPTCRIGFKPDPAALKKLNLPAGGGTLFKPSGRIEVKGKAVLCPTCLGLAYQGRVGVFELMVLDDAARALIADAKLDQLRTHLRKNKMKLMPEAALDKVVAGVTSIAEITRVMAEKKA